MLTRLIEGVPDITTRIATTDTAALLTDAVLYKDADSTNTDIKNIAQEVYITVEDNTLRWAMGASPTQTGSKLGHELSAGKFLMLRGWGQIKAFKHISSTSGSVAIIQATPFFSGK